MVEDGFLKMAEEVVCDVDDDDVDGDGDADADIDVAAEVVVLYFLDRARDPKMAQKFGVNDINGFKDQETAYKAMTNANAGWGKDIDSDFLNSLAKTRDHGEKFALIA